MGILGDSKSTTIYPWGTSLNTALQFGKYHSVVENLNSSGLRDWAISGSTVAVIKGQIDALLTGHASNADVDNCFIINLGVNEMAALPDSATWVGNYLYIIDALKVKYPNSVVYLTKPWKRGYSAQANVLSGWIDSILAERSTFAYVGDDERIWLENGDDGATMTLDGVHYSSAGNTAKITVVRDAIGF